MGLFRGKYVPAGLHAAEASYVSSSSISAFRAPIVRAVWSSKMPLAGTPAILNFLDGPAVIDPAFHIVWARFRMMRTGILLFALVRNVRSISFLSLLLSWALLGMAMNMVGFGSPSLLLE